ncbi:hypothetical protein CC2G_000344 [Coprinopsis cinerea AmutBmut pab1-1]|nr:hypothetical protein CC2G_000344 [Coprinopsis cinerea AmutBmut pab1-1]
MSIPRAMNPCRSVTDLTAVPCLPFGTSTVSHSTCLVVVSDHNLVCLRHLVTAAPEHNANEPSAGIRTRVSLSTIQPVLRMACPGPSSRVAVDHGRLKSRDEFIAIFEECPLSLISAAAPQAKPSSA